MLLTNDGTSGGAALPTAANLPTAKQLQNFGADFGPTYTKYQKLFPNQLPAIDGQRFGNSGSHDMNAVARLWSAPQATWQSQLHESNQFSLACWDGTTTATTICKRTVPAITHPWPLTRYNRNSPQQGERNHQRADPRRMIEQRTVPYTIYPKPTDVPEGLGETADPLVRRRSPGQPWMGETSTCSAHAGRRFRRSDLEGVHVLRLQLHQQHGSDELRLVAR